MTVIEFPRGRMDTATSSPGTPPTGEARIYGTFRSPTGGAGTMTGWYRLGRFIAVSDKLYATGVFTGELLDADGTVVGVGSRRQSAAVDITRGVQGLMALIGPVDVDLLGLTVRVGTFAVEPRRSSVIAHAVSDRADTAG